MTEAPSKTSRIDAALARVTLASHRNPWRVLLAAMVVLSLSWFAASRLEVRGDFLELLPTESPGAQLFRATLTRMGGGSSTFTVVVRSPDAAVNRRVVDALVPRLRALPPTLVKRVEFGPQEARQFYYDRRWLFAELGDLEEVECELARERRRHQPGFIDLDDEPCRELRSDHGAPAAAAPPSAAGTNGAPEPLPANASTFERFRRQISGRVREADQFPSGYFQTPDGTIFAVVMRSTATGTGDATGDVLMARVEALVRALNPSSFGPNVQVGFAGDIPTAIAERDALVKDVALSSGTAVGLILGGIILFFRSFGALVHIGMAMFSGVGVAFAVAFGAFGYLNASTAFLGSIIAGNGINYGILYLARFRERRGEGDEVEAALLDAVRTVRSSTWLAALAAAGAYGSLMLTSFRGFSQFGLIGAVGMVACWCATMALLPATITLWEKHISARFRKGAAAPRAVRAPVAGFVGALTTRHGGVVLLAAFALSVAAAWKLPSYLRDPWEYNFGKLGSNRKEAVSTDAWNAAQDRIFTARGSSPDMLLANRLEEVLPLIESLKARDRAMFPGNPYVDRVETVYDRVGGVPELVTRKLAVLAQVRAHIDALIPYLEGEDLTTARDFRPPESLRAVRFDELPGLVREQFTERDGTFGTPFFVYYHPHFSPNNGRQLMQVARLTMNLRLPGGRVVPTVSRSTVFAEMVASMGRDGPRATFLAALAVVGLVALATRRLGASAAVLGSLLCGVVLTVGGAAWLDVRLNFLNFVALPLTFGIGVEYAINLYDRIRFTGGDVTEAVRSVGGAVALCAFTTIVGYGALLTANSMALQSFGWYAMVGELACISSALLILPSALRLRSKRGGT